MKYQTGAYSSSENLLQLLKDKLVVEGWAVDLHAYVNSADTTFGKRLHIQKNGMFFSLRNFDDYTPTLDYKATGFGKTGIDVRANDSFSAAAKWNEQPGTPFVRMYAQTGSSGIFHLFTTDTKVLLIAEYETERYSHIIFGAHDTLDPGSGGQFLTGASGTFSSTWNIPFDTSTATTACKIAKSDFAGWVLGFAYPADPGQGICSSFNYNNAIRVPNFSPSSTTTVGDIGSSARSSNRLNGLSALMPIYTFVKHEGAYCPFAEFDDLYFINCDLMTAEQTYIVGNRTYKIFPFFGKQTPAVSTQPLFNLGFGVEVDA
ncbi:hypothetical protein [Pseudomonas fluorescens]|uniref:Uncharacterized protein n=1 Tax=Pseudomonas fluorescens TaxID=294 RepID=A0A0F4VEM5_PSEFL|nr:hypothetical protein [Pseudomonas fluorescens]KJZ67241.1 hypothetical protein VD17_02980 [Pseudomonas fluorescens]